MKLVVWNGRGAGGKTFLRNLKELIRMHDPQILVLMETRIGEEKAVSVISKLHFSGSFRVDAQGYSGGIWLLWKKELITVEVLSSNSQLIHTLIRHTHSEDWLFTAVYASPNPQIRTNLWNLLPQVAQLHDLAWLIAGDFNQIGSVIEKSGGAAVNFSRCQNFQSWVTSCRVVDLGFAGPSHTWTNMRSGLARVQERLDKAFANTSWRHMFPEALVRHLPPTHSDHCPVLIDSLGSPPPPPISRPFRFQVAWMTHRDFGKFVVDHWDISKGTLPLLMAKFVEAVQEWNRSTFGNIFHNKRRLLARIEGAQKAMGNKLSPHLFSLERELIKDYNAVLAQEELLWFQKSRSMWLKYGDRNTKFFHTSTLIRRRRNKIEALKGDDGTWSTDPCQLKQMAIYYFQQLYSAAQAEPPQCSLISHFPALSVEELDALNAPLRSIEIKHATKAHSSYTWRSVTKGRELLKRGLRWVLGNGRTVKFWTDVWIGNAPLSTVALGLIMAEDMEKFVVEYVNEHGEWNWDVIGALLPTATQLHIHAVRVFPSLALEDRLVWCGSNSGSFTTSSAYKLLIGSSSTELGYDTSWTKIWKLPGPPRVKFFLWYMFVCRSIEQRMENKKRAELAGLLNMLPPVEFCCAYGSALLPNNRDKTTMVDYILGVSDPMRWHSEITQIADEIGVGVHFNPFVTWEDKMIKYGVVRMHDLVQDILNWERFYLSGRLQKPVVVVEVIKVVGVERFGSVPTVGIQDRRTGPYIRDPQNVEDLLEVDLKIDRLMQLFLRLMRYRVALVLLLFLGTSTIGVSIQISRSMYATLIQSMAALQAQAQGTPHLHVLLHLLPVFVLVDNVDIGNLNSINLKAATSAALLLLPSEFTEEDLYAKICSLSYMGDLRMLFAEDKNKVKKIVQGQFNLFQIMYKPFLEEYAAKELLTFSPSGSPQGKLTQDAEPHVTGFCIEKEIVLILSNGGMDDKLTTVASLGVLQDGRVLYKRCCAHILNLIENDGLDVIKDVIEKVCDSVSFWTTSSKLENFEEAARQLRIPIAKKLSLDCKTRWNSTYLMLLTALVYKDVFSRVMQQVFSRIKYPIANSSQKFEVVMTLSQWCLSSHEVIRVMTSNMLKKFKKYCGVCHVIMAVPIVLNPRLKETVGHNGPISSSCNSEVVDFEEQDPLSNFDVFVSSPIRNALVKSKLDHYLKENVLPQTLDFDDCGVSAARCLVSSLPSTIRSRMGMRLGEKQKLSESGRVIREVVIGSREEATQCMRKVVRRLVMVSSVRQAVSGLLAGGGVNGARYLANKMSKAWNSWT
ncbi:hypothetical protein HHK36_023156 [Tetracentron sinense]|uniref:Phosphatidate cytidylyltransferase, mitochondrial n=2 Tax=Magnoliopsida TaxID=3398 RepID=A0A835D7N2_TETSI|nr:hypothetical protein HHK36_023156 [Tetracentron sinense]